MDNKNKRLKRKQSIRKRITGTIERPRMTVYRSNRYIYVQVIDDVNSKTLAAFTSLKLKETGVKAAEIVGEKVAEACKKAKVTKVVFDRNGYKYHGAVKALADAARKGGLEF